MQERLDDVGASLEAARRQAEADDLLPGPDGQFEGDPVWEDLGIPPGPEDVESPGGDADDSATP